MTEDFFGQYILSLLNTKSHVTTKQLSLISRGKRTPSVLFNVEKNHLYALYALFPELSLRDWETQVYSLRNKQLLTISDEHLLLTPAGIKVKKEFLKKYPFDNTLDQLRYSATKPLFWSRFIFLTQILSEYSYNNKQYTPYLSSIENQMSIKKWLSKQGKSMDELMVLWFQELSKLFDSLPPTHADFIAGHFIGHNTSGSTSRQLQAAFDFSREQYKVFVDYLSYQFAQLGRSEFPLLCSLWEDTHNACDEGLSRSARVSRQFLENGESIDQVARKRHLKNNTIKEHILECVLVTDWPYYTNHINLRHYSACHALIGNKPETSYSEAKEQICDLDFFTYRLVEIERIRENG